MTSHYIYIYRYSFSIVCKLSVYNIPSRVVNGLRNRRFVLVFTPRFDNNFLYNYENKKIFNFKKFDNQNLIYLTEQTFSLTVFAVNHLLSVMLRLFENFLSWYFSFISFLIFFHKLIRHNVKHFLLETICSVLIMEMQDCQKFFPRKSWWTDFSSSRFILQYFLSSVPYVLCRFKSCIIKWINNNAVIIQILILHQFCGYIPHWFKSIFFVKRSIFAHIARPILQNKSNLLHWRFLLQYVVLVITEFSKLFPHWLFRLLGVLRCKFINVVINFCSGSGSNRDILLNKH